MCFMRVPIANRQCVFEADCHRIILSEYNADTIKIWMQKNYQHHVNPQGPWNRALVHATRNAPELCQDSSSPAKGIATRWTLL